MRPYLATRALRAATLTAVLPNVPPPLSVATSEALSTLGAVAASPSLFLGALMALSYASSHAYAILTIWERPYARLYAIEAVLQCLLLVCLISLS